MCLQIINFTQNKLALKPIHDFSPRFGSAILELSADTPLISNFFSIYIEVK